MKPFNFLKNMLLATVGTQHLVEREPAPFKAHYETKAARKVSLKDRVRDHASLIGQTRPAPLILIDALPGKGQ